MLIFPPKASDAGEAGRFEQGNANNLPGNCATTLAWLVARNINQRFIGNGLDITIAQ